MFTQSIRLGRILGIPFGINYSWLVVFVLMTMSLSTYYAYLHPAWMQTEHFFFGVATSILFFASVVLHELGHSVMAKRYGIPVRSITLFVFGGVAQISREPDRPRHDLVIAVAGPLVSALLGGFFLLVREATRGSSEGLASVGDWLGRINLALALFNLIPGFPLDGGRILRAIVWHFTGSFSRATGVAAGAGQAFAYAFIVTGIWIGLTGNVMGGLWIGFVGWFLLTAAQNTVAQAALRSALRGVTARDVMTKDCVRLPGTASVAELARSILSSGARCSMIVDDGVFRGMVTVHELKAVPRDEWDLTSLQSVMVRREDLSTVTPDTPVDEVLQKVNEENIGQVPVVDDGRLLGFIGRDRLLAVVQTHLELKT